MQVGAVDLFHATQLEFPPARRASLIWTLHGLAYQQIPAMLDARFVRIARSWHDLAVRRCQWFVAVSEHTRNEFLTAHPELHARCVTIPLGVGAEFSSTPQPDDVRLRSGIEGNYLLYVGAVARHKNVQGLLAAYELLRERGHTDARLVLVGAVDKDFWAALPAGRFRHDVVLKGHIDQDGPELAAIYRGAQAFVFPSFYEGWASPPLEAMASGVPVVTSNLSSLPETVGDAAVCVDPHDAEAIAEGVRSVLHDSGLRDTLVERGQARSTSFSGQRMARETLALYRRVVD